MKSVDDELRLLRRRIQELQDALDRQRPDPLYATSGPRIMVVTTTLPAATGTTTLTIGTTGRAQNAKYDPTAHALTADTSAPIVMVLNDHTRTFVDGAFIKVMSQFGQLWVFDIHDCAKYV